MARWSGRRVLVTGGAGFIGANLVRALVAEGAHVRVLDNFFTGRHENLAGVTAEVMEGDVERLDDVVEAMRGCSVVFHLAARNIVVSTSEPERDLYTNVVGTFNVLFAARELGVDRVVYASSASVYGNARYLPINEDDEKVILNPYAASKLSAEHYCSAFYEAYGVPVVVVRYSNVYGPFQRPQNPYCGVVSKFLSWAMQGLPLQVHGDGLQTRDYTYVEDTVEGTLAAAWGPPGLVFNVGTGVETSVLELAKLVLKVTGSESRIVHVDRRDIDNVRRRVLNVERSRKMLRWSPRFTLEEGLKRTAEWLRVGNLTAVSLDSNAGPISREQFGT